MSTCKIFRFAPAQNLQILNNVKYCKSLWAPSLKVVPQLALAKALAQWVKKVAFYQILVDIVWWWEQQPPPKQIASKARGKNAFGFPIYSFQRSSGMMQTWWLQYTMYLLMSFYFSPFFYVGQRERSCYCCVDDAIQQAAIRTALQLLSTYTFLSSRLKKPPIIGYLGIWERKAKHTLYLCLKLPLKLIFIDANSESNLDFCLTKSSFSINRILSVHQVFTKTINSLVS